MGSCTDGSVVIAGNGEVICPCHCGCWMDDNGVCCYCNDIGPFPSEDVDEQC